MSQRIEGHCRTFVAGEALEAYRRVKLSAGTVVYADIGEQHLGITEYKVASGAHVAVRLRNAPGTRLAVAAEALAAGAALYGANDGKVQDTSTGAGAVLALALEAATADGDVIEVLETVHAVA